MTDPEFLDLAENLLQSVEATCDKINEETDADVDNQRVGSMVTLTFANRSQIVINLQKPLHEVWMAAKAGGYHYRYARANGWIPKVPLTFLLPCQTKPVHRQGKDCFLVRVQFLNKSIIFCFSSA